VLFEAARPAARSLAAMVTATVLLLAVAGQALADVELSSASPGPDDTVVGTPEELVITFSGPIDPGRSSVLVMGSDGSTVAEGGSGDVSEDATTMTVALPSLDPTTYEVRWTAVATDGHVSRDTYTFTVEAQPSPSPEPSPSKDAPEPSASPEASSSPSPAPSPTPAPAEPTTGDDPLAILLPIAIVGAAVAIVVVWWWRRRSAA
jgi:methionine-rich copper-binding protein CopC